MKNLKHVFVLALMLAGLFLAPAWGKELPRRHTLFELGAAYDALAPQLAAFNCKENGPQTSECILMGYPGRDDFLALKFYQKTLVAIAQFQWGVNVEDVLKETNQRLGKPTMPEYKSDRAIVYFWNDKKTHITLTHLVASGYIVYEIRDVEKEPLYRKAVGYK